jgi:hypothetical protein
MLMVAALGMLLGVVGQTKGGLINGSFENTNGTFVNNGAGYENLAPGSTAIPGWTVVNTPNAPLAWITTPVSFNGVPFTAQDGSFFLDLTADVDRSPYGGVQQSISTTVGQEYNLSFYLGTQQSLSIFTGPVSVQVTAGNVSSNTVTYNPPSGSTGPQWGLETVFFTATSTSTTISIVGSFTSGGDYIGLDNVSVNPVSIPEPASLIMLGIGAVGVIGYTWRRRKQVA